MNTVATMPASANAGFHDVAGPFVQQPGLPFAEVLSAKDIEQAFAESTSARACTSAAPATSVAAGAWATTITSSRGPGHNGQRGSRLSSICRFPRR